MKAPAARVLVVDDDPALRELVLAILERSGYEVRLAADGRAGLRELYQWRPDLVVLDVAMPGLDGWQTLERIRDLSDVPVLMLTGRSGELERVRGLKAGADDYVVKPFGRQEILARVETLLRRAAPRRRLPERYSVGPLEIDVPGRAVRVGGEEVRLTPLEFRLLQTLVEHAGQVLSPEQLLQLVWGGPVGRAQVKLYVGYLRRKLGFGLDGPIETVRGFGYRFRIPKG